MTLAFDLWFRSSPFVRVGRSSRGCAPSSIFFMGAAFLLLETKNVVQFALLFGTTWFVNSLVFAGDPPHGAPRDRGRAPLRSAPAPCTALAAASSRLVPAGDAAPSRRSRGSSPTGWRSRPCSSRTSSSPSGSATWPSPRGVRCEPPGRHGGWGAGVPGIVLGYRNLLLVAAVYALAFATGRRHLTWALAGAGPGGTA